MWSRIMIWMWSCPVSSFFHSSHEKLEFWKDINIIRNNKHIRKSDDLEVVPCVLVLNTDERSVPHWFLSLVAVRRHVSVHGCLAVVWWGTFYLVPPEHRKEMMSWWHVHNQTLMIVSWCVLVSYIFNLFLQKFNDLPLTINHLTVKVNHDPADEQREQTFTSSNHSLVSFSVVVVVVLERDGQNAVTLTGRHRQTGRGREDSPPGNCEPWRARTDLYLSIFPPKVFPPGTSSLNPGTDRSWWTAVS